MVLRIKRTFFKNGRIKMNFMEAVKAMQEGKKVRRKSYEKYSCVFCDGYNIYKTGLNGMIIPSTTHFGIDDFNSTDWELVDDDFDWKLTDHSCGRTVDDEKIYLESSIKKCRDLIKKDFEKHNYAWSWDIVNKRFGEL